MFKQIICEVLETSACPVCRGTLKPRDTRLRIWCEEGHDVFRIKVRRLYCKHCRRLHTELPDCLSPYKHYTSENIEGVLDGVVTPHDETSESYPCEAILFTILGIPADSLTIISIALGVNISLEPPAYSRWD